MPIPGQHALRRPCGFSLLEVMIALAIMATALLALLSLANRSIGVQDRLQKTTRATLLAQQKMAELETADQLPLETEGVFEEPFEQYRWRLEFEQTPLASALQVKVVVAWGDERRNETVDLTSFLFR
jgi:general secretion pathway protein I